MSQLVKSATGAITKPVNRRFQNEDDEDTMLPRVHLFQGLPAEAKQYGKSFKTGDLINTLTGEKITAKKFVPIFAYNQWIAWKEPRGSGMEYQTRDKSEVPAGDLDWTDDKKPKAQKYMNFVVLFEGDEMPVVLSFTKTSLTAGRTLNTLEKLRAAKGAGLYAYDTKEKSNDKGDWVVPVIKAAGDPSAELKAQAEAMFAGFNPDQVTTNIEADGGDEGFDPDAA